MKKNWLDICFLATHTYTCDEKIVFSGLRSEFSTKKKSMDYLDRQGHTFCKETLLSTFSNVFFGPWSTTIRALSSSTLLEGKSDIYGLHIQNPNQSCQSKPDR